MSQMLDTSIGPARVLHRLALALECRDALSDRPVGDALLVGRFRRAPTPADPEPVWRPLTRHGTAEFVLTYVLDNARPLPDLEILVDDPGRRHVPRRFTVRPWQLAEVAEPVRYVAARSRLLRLWLLAGSAYPFPGTTTLIRGRVVQGGRPRRWARVRGTTANGDAGWAHADERGEFVLPITDAGHDLTRDTRAKITVTLDVTGPTDLPDPDPGLAARTTDLVSEVVARSTNPPTPGEMDNDLLRGQAIPIGYAGNSRPATQVEVDVGAEKHLRTPVEFVPQP